MKRIGMIANTKLAVAPLVGSSAALTGVAIDGTGYNRARFVFQLGIPLAGATFDASIFQAATSGATYALVASASLAQITSGASSCVAVIDTKITEATPWLKVSCAVGTSNWPVGVACDLYQGVNRTISPASVQQIVVV